MFEAGPCLASWRSANKSEKERQGITLEETFEEEGRAQESFKDIINDSVNKEIQYTYDFVFFSLYEYQ